MRRCIVIIAAGFLLVSFLTILGASLFELRRASEVSSLAYLVLGAVMAFLSVWRAGALVEWTAGRIPLPGAGVPVGKMVWSVLFWGLIFAGSFLGLGASFGIWEWGYSTFGAVTLGALFVVMAVSAGLAAAVLLVCWGWQKIRKWPTRA